MSLATIKARIKSQLEAVSGIGLVHARMVNARDAEQENALLREGASPQGRVHVWCITRESAALLDESVNQELNERTTNIVVHGFYAVRDDDDSEAAFDALVDAVLEKLNVDRQPAAAGGTKLNATGGNVLPPQLRLADHREYGPSRTLCHHCEIVLQVKEDVQV